MRLSAHTRQLVELALEEDIGKGDVTTRAIGVAGQRGKAVVLGKSDGVLFGCRVFEAVFHQLNKTTHVEWRIEEGKKYKAGTNLATVEGDLAAILTGERVALNFIARLSGIATLTRKFAQAVSGTRAKVLDTRKTTPGWRELEKQATKAGGAVNHRMGLDDAIMIKNNHITACGNIKTALERVTRRQQGAKRKIPIICETRTVHEVRVAIGSGVDWILLDHFGPARLRKVVFEVRRFERQSGRRIILENSGGVTLRNIRVRAQTGVDFLSVGALTQAARAADISMNLI